MDQPDKRTRYQQRLQRDGFIIDVPHGKSMWPMLRNRRDRFVVGPVNGRLNRYDLPVYYRRANDHMVVHRVIKVLEDSYVIRGDNCYYTEHGITDEDIIGVVTSFYRGDRTIAVTDNGYRRYVRFWVGIYGLRFFWHITGYQIFCFARRVIAKLIRMSTGAKSNENNK